MPEHEAAEITADIKRRDAERFELQIAGSISAGRDLLHGNVEKPKPAPLTQPKQAARPLSEETAAVTAGAAPALPRE